MSPTRLISYPPLLRGFQPSHLQALDIKNDDFENSVKYWANVAHPLTLEINPVRFLSSQGYTWHKLDFDPAAGEHPLWDELIGRMSNGKAF